MNDRIKGAFDQIHAEEALKEHTLAYVTARTGRRERPAWGYRRLVPLVACLLLLAVGLTGYWAYFTPTAAISIDVNPSLELEINRFDKVISVQGYNEDGQALASTLDVQFMDYTQALDQILASDEITTLLAGDAVLTIAVGGSDVAQCGRMLSHIETCAQGHENTYCYAADPQDMEDAHDLGLSCGKYQAYLELQALDPSITPEEIQGMTMREIRDMIERLSSASSGADAGQDSGTMGNGSGYGSGGSGNGAGNGTGSGNAGNGNGYGSGSGAGHHDEGHHGYGHSGE